VAKNSIQTYNTQSFRNRFIQQGQKLNNLLKADFDKFFIVKVEDMIKLMKLPVPPTRGITHTLIYLYEGYIEMTIGSTLYKIHKNECLLVPAGQVFSIGDVDVNSGKGYLLNFHNDVVAGKFFEFLTVWGNPVVQFNQAVVLQLVKRLHGLYTEQGIRHLKLIQAYLITLLCEVEAAYRPLSQSTQTKSVALTNKFKELLFTHIKTKHLVTDYAAMLHITPNHLNKVVKQITGKSPTRWIDETLVMEAKVLLHQTGYTITEIATEIGFLDASYFGRLFKKYEGQTPLAFRKKIEKS
jgi:AraC family transcriptional regulator, transcriptional activator of pobA